MEISVGWVGIQRGPGHQSIPVNRDAVQDEVDCTATGDGSAWDYGFSGFASTLFLYGRTIGPVCRELQRLAKSFGFSGW